MKDRRIVALKWYNDKFEKQSKEYERLKAVSDSLFNLLEQKEGDLLTEGKISQTLKAMNECVIKMKMIRELIKILTKIAE